VGVDWPVEDIDEVILSEKDKLLETLNEKSQNFTFYKS
jgi:hypothetical protein